MEPDKDASPEAIEVTPAMLAAGDAAFALFDGLDPLEWILPAVYRAMELARRSQVEPLPEAVPQPYGTP